MRAVAARLHKYDIDSLPADLAQLVLDELIYTASLDQEGLALFSRQHIYNLKLGECAGVEDNWLRHLARSPLQHVSLAACSEVTLHLVDQIWVAACYSTLTVTYMSLINTCHP